MFANINKNMRIIFLIAIVLVSIDVFVLSILSKLFNSQIISIQGTPIKMNYIAAMLSYVFIVLSLYIFVISRKGKVSEAFLLGFLIYGIYELTTKSLLTNWRWSTVFIDTVWGGILFYLTTYFVYNLNRIL